MVLRYTCTDNKFCDLVRPENFAGWDDRIITDYANDNIANMLNDHLRKKYLLLTRFWFRTSGDLDIVDDNLVTLSVGKYKGKFYGANKFSFAENGGTTIQYIASEGTVLPNLGDNRFLLSEKEMTELYWSFVISSGSRIIVQVANESTLDKQIVRRKFVYNKKTNEVVDILDASIFVQEKDDIYLEDIRFITPRFNISPDKFTDINVDNYSVHLLNIVDHDFYREEIWTIDNGNDSYEITRFVSCKDDSDHLWSDQLWKQGSIAGNLGSLLTDVLSRHRKYGMDVPIAVNCVHGKDRTGGFIVIYEILNKWIEMISRKEDIIAGEVDWSSLVETIICHIGMRAGRFVITGRDEDNRFIQESEKYRINYIENSLIELAYDLYRDYYK